MQSTKNTKRSQWWIQVNTCFYILVGLQSGAYAGGVVGTIGTVELSLPFGNLNKLDLCTTEGSSVYSPPIFSSLHSTAPTFDIKLKVKLIPSICYDSGLPKVLMLMHLVRVGLSPAYLADMMTATADLPGRERLRSANSFRYDTPQLKLKFGERGFSYAGPKAWNSLPSNLHELTNTNTFKKTTENSPVWASLWMTNMTLLMHHWSLWV